MLQKVSVEHVHVHAIGGVRSASAAGDKVLRMRTDITDAGDQGTSDLPFDGNRPVVGIRRAQVDIHTADRNLRSYDASLGIKSLPLKGRVGKSVGKGILGAVAEQRRRSRTVVIESRNGPVWRIAAQTILLVALRKEVMEDPEAAAQDPGPAAERIIGKADARTEDPVHVVIQRVTLRCHRAVGNLIGKRAAAAAMEVGEDAIFNRISIAIVVVAQPIVKRELAIDLPGILCE